MTKTFKITVSILLSITAIILYFTLKGEERKKAMIGMITCTLGDLFMVDAFRIGVASLYPGAGFFMLGHIIYGFGFIKASKRKGYTLINGGFKGGVIFTLALTIGLAVLTFIQPEPEMFFFVLLIYIAVIGFNLACQFSYAVNEKGTRYLLILGMSLFIISDFIIFLNMVNVMPAHNDLVWATYIPAQALIILFNSDLKKTKDN